MAQGSTVSRASWTIIDQGIVSLGNFVLAVTLARLLTPLDYGTYSLLVGAFFALQLATTSLVFYPLSVRIPTVDPDEQRGLSSASLVLSAGVCLPLGILIALAVIYFGRADILLPATLAFFLWQMQETLRRCLLSQFRHKAAVLGDAVSYIGQAVVFVAVVWLGHASLYSALLSMAATSAVAILIQAIQVGLIPPQTKHILSLFGEARSIGGWSLASNLMTVLRHQIPSWFLAVTEGAMAVATYQAVVNIVNVTNPMVFGLCNIIPQTAAAARPKGLQAAWHASRQYGLLGMPPTFGYYFLALIVPQVVLQIFYGSGSAYADQTYAARLLLLAWCLSYVGDVICAYLFGIVFASHALVVNAFGTVAVAALALPLSAAFGVPGACIAVLAANGARAAGAVFSLRRILAGDTRPLIDVEGLARDIRSGMRHVIR